MPKVKSVRINMKAGPLEGLFITDIPEPARLVVLIGPNGSGKTSFLNTFQDGAQPFMPVKGFVTRGVEIECHDQPLNSKINLYMRSAYRTQHSLNIQGGLLVVPHGTAASPERIPPPRAQDGRVETNFQNLLHLAFKVNALSHMTWKEAVKDLLSPLSQRLKRLFPYLEIPDIEYPIGGNETGTLETLCFERSGPRYRYEGLSAGEKEVFDLVFDLHMSAQFYQDALYCIDEPELHLHSELQAKLLIELLDLLPRPSQLWIATHSIGIIRKAMELQRSNPGEVAFLNFGELTFSGPQTLKPATADRNLWKNALRVALHDLADLVAPEEIIICEGYPPSTGKPKNAEFDAKAYREIFSEGHPKTEFVSAGSSNDIVEDSIKLATALGVLVRGVKIVRLIDRDNKSSNEVAQLRANGLKVLTRYSIENYLWSDEILTKLMRDKRCATSDEQKILASKAGLVGRVPGAPEDPMENIKDQEGLLYVECRKIPQLRGLGSSTYEFALQELAPLVTGDTNTYKALEQDVFS